MKNFFTKQNLAEFFIEGIWVIDSLAFITLMVLTGVYIADNDPELYNKAKELITAGAIPIFATVWIIANVMGVFARKIYDRHYPETKQEPA